MATDEDDVPTLAELAEQLRQFSLLPSEIREQSLNPWIRRRLAKYAADALDRYLSGKVKTLDAAFGLAPANDLPKRPGPQPDVNRNAEIIKQAIPETDALRRQRTKHHNPAAIKDKIARDIGVSRRTVERAIAMMERFFAREIAGDGALKKLKPHETQAVLVGVAAATKEMSADEASVAAFIKEMRADEAKEQAAHQRSLPLPRDKT